MILLIDNYDSFTYNLYQILAQLDDEVMVVRNDKISITEIKTINPAGIILSPGPGRPENAGICVEIIKTLSGNIPILGVCLGHQAIAFAFGGTIKKSDEIVHGKSSLIFHSRSDLYADMPLPFDAARYHSLDVQKNNLPDSLLIQAENNEGMIMGIKHKEHPTYGVQFHPESILSESGSCLIKNFVDECHGETVC